MGKKDLHRANETRSVLAPLAEISAKFRCSTVIVRHLKKGDSKSIYRGLGSIDILAAVRSVLLVGVDPQDKDKRVLVHNKSNLAQLGESLGYTIEGNQFSWTGPSKLGASEILGSDVFNTDEKSVLEEACEFLLDLLKFGPLSAADIFKQARQNGFSEKTLRRAKGFLKVKSQKSGNQWNWVLISPKSDKQEQGGQGAHDFLSGNDDHLGHLEEKQVNYGVENEF